MSQQGQDRVGSFYSPFIWPSVSSVFSSKIASMAANQDATHSSAITAKDSAAVEGVCSGEVRVVRADDCIVGQDHSDDFKGAHLP